MPLSPSGEVVAVVQATTASGPGGNRTLGVEKPIYSGDKIKTGAIGNAQLKFLDNTRFVIGPKSNVVIDRYIFNPDRTLAGASITMARGAFRFISGTGPKRAYRIKTPTATIGIRGTQVDVAVGRSLGTAVLVFKGAVELCNRRSGQCKLVKAGCGAAVAKPAGDVWVPEEGRGTSQFINANFPLTQRQGRLPRGFRVSTQDCDQHSVTPRSPTTRSQQASFTPDPEEPDDRSDPEPGGGNDGGNGGGRGDAGGGGNGEDGGNDGGGDGGGEGGDGGGGESGGGGEGSGGEGGDAGAR